MDAYSWIALLTLIITVDCGITSCDAVNVARNKGIDVIVTDHHEAGNELPQALAVINPKVYPNWKIFSFFPVQVPHSNSLTPLSSTAERKISAAS